MTIAFAALVAGFVHVLCGPDHLAAVAPYVVGRKSGGWRIGFRWGLGHVAGVFGVGALALMSRHAFPVETVSTWGERLVGIVLLGIGIRGLSVALARRLENDEDPELVAWRPDHGVDQPSGSTRSNVPGRAALGVGTLHGLAGSSHLLGILPALALPSETAAVIYLLVFGVGSVTAMAVFAALVGWITTRRVAGSVPAQMVLLGICSLVAIAVGCYWIVSDVWFLPRAAPVG
jgi:hypothetical protein